MLLLTNENKKPLHVDDAEAFFISIANRGSVIRPVNAGHPPVIGYFAYSGSSSKNRADV
jgi:hypothetical protein